MGAPDLNPERQLQREKVLYQYRRAMERGDLATALTVLRQAQSDAELERMILEVNEALVARSAISASTVAREPAAARAPNTRESNSRMFDLRSVEPHSGPGLSGSLRQFESRRRDGDQEYSESVAEVLAAAYRSLESGHTAATDRATFEELHHCLEGAMTPRQRLRVYYVTGLAYFRAQDYTAAIDCFTEAFQLAQRHGSPGDRADLLYLRGRAHRNTGEVEQAAADLRECLKLIRGQNDGAGEDDIAFELAVLARLAKYEFLLAQQIAAQECVSAALLLLPQALRCRAEAEQIAWVQALLYRWRGQPELALRPASVAAEIASALGEHANSLRLHLLMADVCLDLAHRLTSDADRAAFIELAGTHIGQAESVPDSSDDRAGSHLIALARARYQRVSHPADGFAPRLAAIQNAARAARMLGDIALLVQADTALGDELMAQDKTDLALKAYREALAHLEGTQMPALGVWARRMLYRAHEMRD